MGVNGWNEFYSQSLPTHTDDTVCPPLGLNGSVQFPQLEAGCQVLAEHKQTTELCPGSGWHIAQDGKCVE